MLNVGHIKKTIAIPSRLRAFKSIKWNLKTGELPHTFTKFLRHVKGNHSDNSATKNNLPQVSSSN